MKLAASEAISKLVTDEDIANGIIIPSAFNKGVVEQIAKAVADAAVKTGVARINK
jgi:malate dehydrogenase (oxaloacetate-decarboxylating)